MFHVYILASRNRSAIYIGSTDNLAQRIEQHRAGTALSHTTRYAIHRLVWFETHETREQALIRERRLKRWRRAWKAQLIEEGNPDWLDISDRIQH